MTRQDYINHLDRLRAGVSDLISFDKKHKDLNGPLVGATPLEEDRAKKTRKMFDDLEVRLYEDAGVSEKVRQEKCAAGDVEQSEISFAAETLANVTEIKEEDAAPKKSKKRGGAK